MAGLSVSKCRLIDSNGPSVVTEVVGDNASEVLEKTCSSMSWWKYASVEKSSEVRLFFIKYLIFIGHFRQLVLLTYSFLQVCLNKVNN